MRRLLHKRNFFLAAVGVLLLCTIRIRTLMSWDESLRGTTATEEEQNISTPTPLDVLPPEGTSTITDQVHTPMEKSEKHNEQQMKREKEEGTTAHEEQRRSSLHDDIKKLDRQEKKEVAREGTALRHAEPEVHHASAGVKPPPFHPIHRARPGTNESCFDPRRDYNVWPIRVEGWWHGDHRPCDVPCHGGRGGPLSQVPDGGYNLGKHYLDAEESGSHKDPCMATYSYTMENVGAYYNHDHSTRFLDTSRSIDIHGTVQADSDVMMQYFSWFEYPIMSPISPKTADAPVVAFITNCGPRKRLEWLRAIQQHGVRVHSYGPCENNKPQLPRIGLWLEQKNNITRPYKFTWSFENSEAHDYVTEKLFGPFTVGSIPIYDGAPNVKDFLPAPKSAIFAKDFSSPEELAKYILYLDGNDTAYQEYLQWKATSEDGPTVQFMAHADISRSHFRCRFCTRVADIQRFHVGQQFVGNPWHEENELAKANNQGLYMVRVRERGKFWLREIYISEATHKALMAAITERYQDQPDKFPIYAIYDLWDSKKTPIVSDDQVRELITSDAYPEVEIIFLEPGAPNRYSYTDWYYKKIGKPVPPRPQWSGYE